jgi:tripartite-type tricarboxylate transporter receptor subunit TctC
MPKPAFRLATMAAAALTAIVALPAASGAWEPTKQVEIIVPAGAGGASDQMARMIQGIVTKHNLMKRPIIVTIKGGANGAEGYIATKASRGDPHKFVIGNSALYTLPLASGVPLSWQDLTPVAIVALDEFILWVNSETPYKTAGEYVAAVKAAPPESMKMGGTGSKREDHIITTGIERLAGVRFSYIPYKSGGEAATQLVGKHIESNVNNPSENLGQWRAGQVRALCVFDNQRMTYTKKVTTEQSWADIPTCKEAGLDFEYLMLRAIMLPGGVTKEQVAFYEDLMRKVTETPEYKEYMEVNALRPAFLTGAELTSFLERDEKLHRDLMSTAGFLSTN